MPVFNETFYALPLIILLTSPIHYQIIRHISTTICIFLLIKWLSDYKKCTISYLECKYRGVKKHQGYIYCYLEPVLNLNKHRFNYVFYLFAIFIIVLNKTASKLKK